jgi:hypothetical protein
MPLPNVTAALAPAICPPFVAASAAGGAAASATAAGRGPLWATPPAALAAGWFAARLGGAGGTARPALDPWGLQRFVPAPVLQAWRPVVEVAGPAADALRATLRGRLRIDPATTLAVVHHTSPGAVPAPPQAWLALAQRLTSRQRGWRVWIVSDDDRVRRLFTRAYGERCFFVRPDDPLLRDVSHDEPGMAAAALAAEAAGCAQIITPSGPLGMGLCLLRGHAQGLWQFDDEGQPLNPAVPGCWLGAVRRAARKRLRHWRLRL